MVQSEFVSEEEEGASLKASYALQQRNGVKSHLHGSMENLGLDETLKKTLRQLEIDRNIDFLSSTLIFRHSYYFRQLIFEMQHDSS